jgi:hypothetical protein
MNDSVISVVEPFVRRGLFASPEQAIVEMARDYILRQVEYYRANIQTLEARYGMNYTQFDAYLKARSQTLVVQSDPGLNRAVMQEEDDALDWKIARDMLENWLGLEQEVAG